MYNIGIITSEYSLHNIMKIDIRMRKKCHISYLPYSSLEHLVFLYRENAALFDGFLFAGAFPYNVVLEQAGTIPRPAVYFSLTATDYYRVIAKIAIHNRQTDFRRVLFDAPEIPVDFSSVFPADEFPLFTEEDEELSYWEAYEPSLDYYRKLWESGRIDRIVTRFSSMKEFFEKSHIPYELLLPSEESMTEALDSLLLQIAGEKAHDSATCVGIVRATREHGTAKQKRLLEELKNCNTKFGSLFLIYEKEDRVELTTNLFALKELTQNYTFCPICAYLKNTLPFGVSIGFGCGETAVWAHNNAQKALNKALQFKSSCTCITPSENIIIGPLTGAASQNGTTADPESFAARCAQIGLPAQRIKGLLAIYREKKDQSLTASELAQRMEMSPRTASRLLNFLEEQGLAESFDLHQINKKGRPARVYRLKF